ncbi:twin-arginine translocase TatA/TatE family subunit [Paenibacillus spiritus]|uniref:Sec-independent protein translocase protein TatA n=1 Tax=Paenibacillus spiritus TaxID=2496557 RepID=A0A5J5G9G1_9BACL|nr:twin-arginine translocase TatA/TatE family subunit [Paenibacillus spiritus]KAA9004819.1 twin-arginine translocase TatA/TatE family subunit [Paenibacillus spiritus]
MFNSIGTPGFILLAILALLLFGPNKLPELGRAVGRTFREFKDGTREVLAEDSARAASGPQQTAQAEPDKRLP